MCQDEDMDQIEAVMANGPHVMERIVCDLCETEIFAFHPFCESISCPVCGGRSASKVSLCREVDEVEDDET